MAKNYSLTSQDDRGELVSKIGPLSIFRTAIALHQVPSDDSSDDNDIEIEHRYTIRIDADWMTEGGVVAIELERPYYSAETGNRLDTFGSLVEFLVEPDAPESEVAVFVVDPTSTEEKGAHTRALKIRRE